MQIVSGRNLARGNTTTFSPNGLSKSS